MKSMFIDLIATSFLVRRWRPRLTLPNAPLPSILPILYNSSCVFGGLLYFLKQSYMSYLINATSFDLGLSYITAPFSMFLRIYCVVDCLLVRLTAVGRVFIDSSIIMSKSRTRSIELSFGESICCITFFILFC